MIHLKTLKVINKFIILILLTLGVNNIQAQSYDTPPDIAFVITKHGPSMALLSKSGKGILSGTDTLAFKVYNSDEYKVSYNEVSTNLATQYEHLLIPSDVMDNLKKVGVEYIRINDTYYYYDAADMLSQSRRATIKFKDY